FPADPYDRIWSSFMDPSWSTLSSSSNVNNSLNMFEPPSAVMQTAVTPASGSQLVFSWDSVSPDDELYAVLHFAELQNLTGNATRMFNITRNGELRYDRYTPPYLSADFIYSNVPFEGSSRYEYVLNSTSDSTLPPIINAFEVYSLMQLTQAATDSGDVSCLCFIRYHQNYQLTEKSDVYSFGVVLLELITGRPPIVPGPGNAHILKLVAASVSRGCIEEIMDYTLHGEYDATSAWKILDVALRCTAGTGSQRPTMFEVVTQLKSCLKPEIASDRNDIIYIEGSNMSREISSEMGTSLLGPTVPSLR
ncbi:hypothetical protein BHE74_00023987, partial [Ensete ventricosum]